MNRPQPDEVYLTAFRQAISVSIVYSRKGIINHGARLSIWLTNHTKKIFPVDHFYFSDLFQPERFLIIDEEGNLAPCTQRFGMFEKDSPRRSFDAIPGVCWTAGKMFSIVAYPDCLRIGLSLHELRQGGNRPSWNEYSITPGKRYTLTYQLMNIQSNVLDLEPLFRDVQSIPYERLKSINAESLRQHAHL